MSYQGLIDVGNVQAGETVVVSAAAGATGSMACNLAKDKGAKVYGTAGSDEKCRYPVEQEVSVAKAFNYKSATFHEDSIREVGTFDLLFDSVGGEFLDFALSRMNPHARVILCGESWHICGASRVLITYGDRFHVQIQWVTLASTTPTSAYCVPLGSESYVYKNLPEVLAKRAKIEGFTLYVPVLFACTLTDTEALLLTIDGLEEAPNGINILFTGENQGKLCVIFFVTLLYTISWLLLQGLANIVYQCIYRNRTYVTSRVKSVIDIEASSISFISAVHVGTLKRKLFDLRVHRPRYPRNQQDSRSSCQ